MKHLHPNQVIYLYERIIRQSGGKFGLRDKGLLESAVYRPQASFGGKDLFPDLFGKAAALGHAILSNHPFLDGNKRVGFEAMRLMLRLNGFDLRAAEQEKFTVTMRIAKGEMTEQAIADWLKEHSRPYAR